jgi:hypothetical protein
MGCFYTNDGAARKTADGYANRVAVTQQKTADRSTRV